MSKSTFNYFLTIGIFLVILLFHTHEMYFTTLIDHRDGHIVMQDFTYHLMLVRAFWFDGVQNIYTPAAQLQVLSSFAHENLTTTMPIGVTPISFLLWLPFAYISQSNLQLAAAAWTALSLVVFFFGIQSVLVLDILQRNRVRFLFYLSLIFLVSTSYTANLSIALGQTSIIATGGMLLLSSYLHHREAGSSLRTTIIAPLIILSLLSFKPTYLALALGLLVIHARWKELIVTLATFTVVLVFLVPWFGSGYLPQYVQSLTVYTQPSPPSVYQLAIAPETMVLFRTAFSPLLGDLLALNLSQFVAVLIYLAALVLPIVWKTAPRSFQEILMFSSFLLFASYWGAYEDLLLLAPFLCPLTAGRVLVLLQLKSFLLVIGALIYFNYGVLTVALPLWVLWFIKCGLLTMICARVARPAPTTKL